MWWRGIRRYVAQPQSRRRSGRHCESLTLRLCAEFLTRRFRGSKNLRPVCGGGVTTPSRGLGGCVAEMPLTDMKLFREQRHVSDDSLIAFRAASSVARSTTSRYIHAADLHSNLIISNHSIATCTACLSSYNLQPTSSSGCISTQCDGLTTASDRLSAYLSCQSQLHHRLPTMTDQVQCPRPSSDLTTHLLRPLSGLPTSSARAFKRDRHDGLPQASQRLRPPRKITGYLSTESFRTTRPTQYLPVTTLLPRALQPPLKVVSTLLAVHLKLCVTRTAPSTTNLIIISSGAATRSALVVLSHAAGIVSSTV